MNFTVFITSEDVVCAKRNFNLGCVPMVGDLVDIGPAFAKVHSRVMRQDVGDWYWEVWLENIPFSVCRKLSQGWSRVED